MSTSDPHHLFFLHLYQLSALTELIDLRKKQVQIHENFQTIYCSLTAMKIHASIKDTVISEGILNYIQRTRSGTCGSNIIATIVQIKTK